MNKIITSILMVGMVAGVAAQVETERQKTLKKLQEHYQRHDAKVKSVLERKADELMSPPLNSKTKCKRVGSENSYIYHHLIFIKCSFIG